MQLDLFGDYIEDKEEEDGNGIPDSSTSESSLERVPTEEIQKPGGIGKTEGREQRGGEEGQGNDAGVGIRERNEGNGGAGNSNGRVRLSTEGRIDYNNVIIPKTESDKIEANLRALEIIKQLDIELRYANDEERYELVKYTGWGGIPKVFEAEPNGKYLQYQNRLKSILTEAEYDTAKRSILNAHYTDRKIAEVMWKTVERLGYKGGPVLEPAVGTGVFIGTQPNLPVVFSGIELDTMTAKIAKNIYQHAIIRNTGYENVKLEANKFNLIISNVPFSEVKPYEDKNAKTPGLDGKYALHDYYFLKSLHGLKEGGIIAFISSRYTMDKESDSVRTKIAEVADFIGAIRLPSTAHTELGNTSVITDIIYLIKRHSGEEISDLTKLFINVENIEIENKAGEKETVRINAYYKQNPDMIMGRQEGKSSQYAHIDYTVTLDNPELLIPRLEAKISEMPENIANYIDNDSTDHNIVINDNTTISGAHVVGKDSRLYWNNPETGNIELSPLYNNTIVNRVVIDKLLKLTTIANTTRTAIENKYNNDTAQSQISIHRLNMLYDNYVQQYGYISNAENYKLISLSPDAGLLCALERYDLKRKIAEKADIFYGISHIEDDNIGHARNAEDALMMSLAKYGYINISYMESVAGMERDIITSELLAKEIIYQKPEDLLESNRINYVTSDEYLSGNVRIKLRNAITAQEQYGNIFNRNVVALNEVLPRDLEPSEINIKINTPVVGKEIVKQYIAYMLDIGEWAIKLNHYEVNGKWELTVNYAPRDKLELEYGTPHANAIELLESILNNKPIAVYDIIEDKKVLNDEKTAMAEQKADLIKDTFNSWIWSDNTRTVELTKLYNEMYNSHVERTFVHPGRIIANSPEIKLPGCMFSSPLRANQADIIWRIVQQKNVMVAHEVGAGKTLTMICGSMELKRLGLRSKNMIVCPDHMIGQWSRAIRESYPQAKLLIADEINWEARTRKLFINRIATGDWDIVVIRAESFKMIPLSREYQIEFFREKISEYKESLEGKDRGSRNRTAKQLEKAVASYEAKVKALLDMDKDSDVIPFDKLGIDQLFIDEADLYKNLEYYTNLSNVRGLGDPTGSERALDLYMKVKVIQAIGGGVVFATGTPISNTLVEAYTMQRYLQPEMLKMQKIQSFDDWARQYADTITQMELNNTGTGYKVVTRFSKIVNVPELVSNLRQVWDIKTSANLEELGILVPGVNLPYAKYINVTSPANKIIESYLKELERREHEANTGGNKSKDNTLKVITDGRKASLDIRLINPHIPVVGQNKISLAASRIYDVYDRTRSESLTQAIFCDQTKSYDSDGNILFDAMKELKLELIKLGVNKDDIVDIRDIKSREKQQDTFMKVDSGKIRIIFGSTETMGAGTNFQTKLKAIHHISAPWRPRDITQRVGRGKRQGNTTGEIEIYTYIQKGSLDTGTWNILETKARAIASIMDGTDKCTREIEEDYFGTVKELSIENPIMKEALTLEHEIKKLKTLKAGQIHEIASAKRKLNILPGEISTAREIIANVTEDITSRSEEKKGDEFEINIKGNVVRERKIAGTIIINELAKLYEYAKLGHSKELEIGNYAGCKLLINSKSSGIETAAIGRAILRSINYEYSSDILPSSDPVGVIMALHRAIYKRPEEMINSNIIKIDNIEKTMGLLEEIASKEIDNSELETLEQRHKLLLKMMEEESNQTRDTSTINNIPWNQLNEMNAEEVMSIFNEYNNEIKTTKLEKSSGNAIDIREVEGVVPQIYKDRIKHELEPVYGYDKVKAILNNIVAKVETYKKSWIQIKDTLYYTNAESEIDVKSGDISIISKDNVHKAYLVSNEGNSKYLGSESDIEYMIKRVETYYRNQSIVREIGMLLQNNMHSNIIGNKTYNGSEAEIDR